MKRMYEKLMAYEEAFVANEYVAACYGLACSVVLKLSIQLFESVINLKYYNYII